LGAIAKFRKATSSFVRSVRPSVSMFAWNKSAPTGWMSTKFDIGGFMKTLPGKFKCD